MIQFYYIVGELTITLLHVHPRLDCGSPSQQSPRTRPMQTSTALLTSLLTLAACAASSDPIEITIESAQGVDRHELTHDELLATVAAPVPAYRVDGVTTTDPSSLFTGSRIELPLPDYAGTVVATRVGEMLHTETVDVSWRSDHTSLKATTSAGAITIDVT